MQQRKIKEKQFKAQTKNRLQPERAVHHNLSHPNGEGSK